MPPLEEARRPMATLSRRALLAAAPAATLAACQPAMRTTVSTTPKLDIEGMNRAIARLAGPRGVGALGVGLANLESGESYTFNGERRFPMQSVFKALLGAYALSEAEAGRIRLTDTFDLDKQDLSAPWSPIGAAWPARRTFTTDELLAAAVVDSDNTAADVLMKRIGGPGALSAWLEAKHIPEVRVDRYEREIQPEAHGMASFRPEWRTDAGFSAAEAAVPAAARAAALRNYMSDPRDTATPTGMLEFLKKLDASELTGQASTRRLVTLMSQTPRAGNRIRAGLPKDAFLAHKPGTAGVVDGVSSAHNDVGVFRLADRRSYAICVFVSGSTLDEAGRDRVIADATRAAVRAVG